MGAIITSRSVAVCRPVQDHRFRVHVHAVMSKCLAKHCGGGKNHFEHFLNLDLNIADLLSFSIGVVKRRPDE